MTKDQAITIFRKVSALDVTCSIVSERSLAYDMRYKVEIFEPMDIDVLKEIAIGAGIEHPRVEHLLVR